MSDDFRQSGGSPWGTPPGGGSGNGSGKGPTPPDIDKIIRDIQNKIKRIWEINTRYLNLKNCYNIPHTATVMTTKLVKKIGDYKIKIKRR